MNPELIKLLIAFISATVIFLIMLKLQNRKEREAQLQFERRMKSLGLSSDIEKGDKRD